MAKNERAGEGMIRSDGNGHVIVDKGTGLSLGLVVMIIGGLIGFFTAWAVPGIRTQQDVTNHIQNDKADMVDHEDRIRLLEAFKSQGGRYSIQQHYTDAAKHQVQHREELAVLTEAINGFAVEQAKTNTRLQAIERKVNGGP